MFYAFTWPKGPSGPIPTVAGPEDPTLDARVRGHVVLDTDLTVVALASGEQRALRPRGSSGPTIHSVSGPDELGRIAFVENFMSAKRHRLRVTALDGELDRVLFERDGDALWSYNGDEIGDYLALAPRGGKVAFVENLDRVQMRDPSALLARGKIALWSIDAGEELPFDAFALDDQLAWFPDGRRIAYTDFVPRAEGEALLRQHVERDDPFGHDYLNWEQFPVVFVGDTETGTQTPWHVGTRPVVSPDSNRMFVRGFTSLCRIYDRSADRSRALDVPGGTWASAIAFIDADLLLYRGLPTAGFEQGWTEFNSPVSGPKPMLTLKVLDLASGGFRTVPSAIDPRENVGFGIVTGD